MTKNEVIIFESVGRWVGKIFTLNHISVFTGYFSICNSIYEGLDKSLVYLQLCFLINVIITRGRPVKLFRFKCQNKIEILKMAFISKELILAVEIFCDCGSNRAINKKKNHGTVNKTRFYRRSISSKFLFRFNIFKNHSNYKDLLTRRPRFRQKGVYIQKTRKNPSMVFLELVTFDIKSNWMYIKIAIGTLTSLVNSILCGKIYPFVICSENLINASCFIKKYFFSNFYKKKIRSGISLNLEIRKILGNHCFGSFFFFLKKCTIKIRLLRYTSILSDEFVLKNFRLWKLFLYSKNNNRNFILVSLKSLENKTINKKIYKSSGNRKLLPMSSLFRPDSRKI